MHGSELQLKLTLLGLAFTLGVQLAYIGREKRHYKEFLG